MALIKDFSKIAGSSFINLLIGLLATPLITRLVSPEQYGNWSLFCVYSTVLASILLLGTDYIIVRYYYKYDDDAYQTKLTRWCCIIALMAVLFSSIPIVFVLHHLRPNWTWIILCLLIVNIIINVLNRLINILLRFKDKINVLSIGTLLHKVIFVLIAVTSLYCFKGDNLIFLSVSSVLSTGITVLFCFYFVRLLFFNRNIQSHSLSKREMVYYGLPLMVSGCSYLLFQATDKLIIGHFCSESELGIYSSACSFLSIFAILQNSFTTVWWPSVMKNFEQTPENKMMYIRANDIICLLTTILGFTFILLKDLIILLLGPDYHNAVVILPFIIFQPILYTLSETTVIGLNFQKKSKTLFIITIVSLFFNLFVNILLTKLYGIVGTSIAVGLSYVFFCLLRTFISYHYYKINFNFAKMFVSVGLLFLFALIHSIFSDNIYSYLLVIVLYILVFIMYKDILIYIMKKYIKNNN